MLYAANCAETIVNSYHEYEELAVQYATNKEKFEQLKEQTIKNVKVSPLFDTRQYVKDFEKALLQTWNNYNEGGVVEHIDVMTL